MHFPQTPAAARARRIRVSDPAAARERHIRVSDPAAARVRRIRVSDPDALAAAQPEKNRRYLQLEGGPFGGELLEARLEAVQIFRETIARSVRLEASPPSDVLPFGVMLAEGSDSRFCGRPLRPGEIAQATGGAWDVRSLGGIDYVACAFDREAFVAGCTRLTGRPPDPRWLRPRVLETAPAASRELGGWLAAALARLVGAPGVLETPVVRRSLEAEVLRRTVAALTSADPAVERRASPARRRRGVARVVEYLEAHARQLPSIADLCAVAGLSERSLEYAFRDLLGVTPIRYVKLVRLNGARRDLRDADAATARVTQIALHWGFSELGRFAGEYRALFGEHPSVTLRRASG